MISNIDHINIVVHDMVRMVDFYTAVLGFRATKTAHLEGEWVEQVVGLKGVQAEVVFLECADGGPRIELIQYRAPVGAAVEGLAVPNTPGLRHIALRVANIAAAHARVVAAGVKVFGIPVLVPNGVVQHDAGDKRLFYFVDPEGTLLELTQYT